MHDISDLLEHEDLQRWHEGELRQSQEEIEVLAEQVPAAMFRTDHYGAITFANGRFHELVGHDAHQLLDIVHTGDAPRLLDAIQRLSAPGGPDGETLEVRHRDGRTLSLACRAVGAMGGPAPRVIIGSVTDATLHVKLRHDAEHDGLTGLRNRKAIMDGLRASLDGDDEGDDEGDDDGVLIAFIDLDGFKPVNDDHGHQAGDTVLQEVARRLRDAVRPTDIVGRLGGDEFVVVFDALDEDGKHSLVERVEIALSEPVSFGSGAWKEGASIGLARSRPGESAADLLERADREMYDAKQHRRV